MPRCSVTVSILWEVYRKKINSSQFSLQISGRCCNWCSCKFWILYGSYFLYVKLFVSPLFFSRSTFWDKRITLGNLILIWDRITQGLQLLCGHDMDSYDVLYVRRYCTIGKGYKNRGKSIDRPHHTYSYMSLLVSFVFFLSACLLATGADDWQNWRPLFFAGTGLKHA